MIFGVKLANEIYPPWKEHYMNYEHLKRLLKENIVPRSEWTEADESAFVKALDGELEKVYSFQKAHYELVNAQISALEAQAHGAAGTFDVAPFTAAVEEALFQARSLDKFARVNFTGFVKIVRKHDRLHPTYSVQPVLNVRLKELPFHLEDYLPLLYRLSGLYNFLRENYTVNENLLKMSSFKDDEDMNYQSLKFWVHPDNLMEVKTTLLRHLPVLVYDNLNDDVDDDDNDPTITTLYLDNNSFDLYNDLLIKENTSKTLRVRWTGKLMEKPDIYLEKKIMDDNHELVDTKLQVKEKYLNDLVIKTEFPTQKLAAKMKKRGDPQATVDQFVSTVNELKDLIHENDLQPVLRSVYKRTAFQIPGDDKVRVLIDSDIIFIREDSFDEERPIRDPTSWHRTDIDSRISNPYQLLRKNESTRFPYALMEIQVRQTKHRAKWIAELLDSHLVRQVPNFSKFVQGIAALFTEDDRLDSLPYWITDLDVVAESPAPGAARAAANDISLTLPLRPKAEAYASAYHDDYSDFSSDDDYDESDPVERNGSPGALQHLNGNPLLVPRKSMSQSRPYVHEYVRANKLDVDSEDEEVVLPSGVKTPTQWIKNLGPLKIEPKVWLANERTLNHWLHISAMFSALTFMIYNSVKSANYPELAIGLAYGYLGLTLFSMYWGWLIYNKRLTWIKERGSKHLDGPLGPIIVCVGLLVALTVNFVAGMHRIAQRDDIVVFMEEMGPVQRGLQEMAFAVVGASRD
ncbi:hypothetical protein BABINDRAFT_158967 [Babjeviella inositovora NRRL Y-12698]|uniref:SPX domain-containing protein n=1 Tax=Babjeviella inositovora NRRL Y-12698 TaxID=984486 RepID=A0A1E3QZ45_9ASCO|nr:uncharacterized protein BABINDRAFT_158967 [Babjeviella inositovora NRRL Y-12698]ODQ82352.1 hypothetical protein BABINDRAFT_158967 [Babjeviella inositovora NRRL Y-12698]